MKVLLVNPMASAHWDRRIPFSLAYLAAEVRKFYPVRITDMPAEDISEQILINIIREGGYAVVGLTGMSHQIESAYSIIKRVKKETEAMVIVGGCHVTFLQEEALKSGADLVVVGEGEETFLEVLKTLEGAKRDYSSIKGVSYFDAAGKMVFTGQRELSDLRRIPSPARDLLPIKKYTDARIFGVPALEFMFGRGCPYNCIFCSSPRLWRRKVRLFDLDRILTEIGECVKRYKNRYIFITDDVFTVRKDFVFDFCQRIEPMRLKWWCMSRVDMVDREMLLRMKKAGCVGLSYGVESGNQKILDFEHKGIKIERIREVFSLHREIGLPAKALLIVGHPLETKDTIKESMDLAQELHPFGYICAQMMCPYIGTELRESVAEKTGVVTTSRWSDYVTWKYPPVFIPRDLDAETVYKAAQKFAVIKGTTFSDYVMAFKLVGPDMFNWNFFFRPILANSAKKILPDGVKVMLKRLRRNVCERGRKQ